jgi:hypothetical protein
LPSGAKDAKAFALRRFNFEPVKSVCGRNEIYRGRLKRNSLGRSAGAAIAWECGEQVVCGLAHGLVRFDCNYRIPVKQQAMCEKTCSCANIRDHGSMTETARELEHLEQCVGIVWARGNVVSDLTGKDAGNAALLFV